MHIILIVRALTFLTVILVLNFLATAQVDWWIDRTTCEVSVIVVEHKMTNKKTETTASLVTYNNNTQK